MIEPYRNNNEANNIEEYNKLKGVEKMTYNYLLIDELSILMPDKSDSKNEKKLKEEILAYLKKLSKLGRAAGKPGYLAPTAALANVYYRRAGDLVYSALMAR